MTATLVDIKQDYLTESERLHVEENPGTVLHIVTLIRRPDGDEKLLRLFVDGEGFAAVRDAVNPIRKALGLQKYEIYEALPVKDIF